MVAKHHFLIVVLYPNTYYLYVSTPTITLDELRNTPDLIVAKNYLASVNIVDFIFILRDIRVLLEYNKTTNRIQRDYKSGNYKVRCFLWIKVSVFINWFSGYVNGIAHRTL